LFDGEGSKILSRLFSDHGSKFGPIDSLKTVLEISQILPKAQRFVLVGNRCKQEEVVESEMPHFASLRVLGDLDVSRLTTKVGGLQISAMLEYSAFHWVAKCIPEWSNCDF
jgi:hypothetical protein